MGYWKCLRSGQPARICHLHMGGRPSRRFEVVQNVLALQDGGRNEQTTKNLAQESSVRGAGQNRFLKSASTNRWESSTLVCTVHERIRISTSTIVCAAQAGEDPPSWVCSVRLNILGDGVVCLAGNRGRAGGNVICNRWRLRAKSVKCGNDC